MYCHLQSVVSLLRSHSSVLIHAQNNKDSESAPTWMCMSSTIDYSHIRYLGIEISPKLSEPSHLNYTPSIKTVEDNLRRWMNLVHSHQPLHYTVLLGKLKNLRFNYPLYKNQNLTGLVDWMLQTRFTILHIKYNISPNGPIKVTTRSHGLTSNSHLVKILNSQIYLF